MKSAEFRRQRCVQVTAQRSAVHRAASARPHIAAHSVAEAVRGEIGAISRQTVDDALGVLTDNGDLRHVQPAGSPALYDDRVGENHHHLVCRDCGGLVDVDCAVGDAPCLVPADASSFDLDEAEVVYWGRCPQCLGSTPVSATD